MCTQQTTARARFPLSFTHDNRSQPTAAEVRGLGLPRAWFPLPRVSAVPNRGMAYSIVASVLGLGFFGVRFPPSYKQNKLSQPATA